MTSTCHLSLQESGFIRNSALDNVPRDPFNPLSEQESFSHRDFWRRFERIVLRDLSKAHAAGVRGIQQCAADVAGTEPPSSGHPLTVPVGADFLRKVAAQTGSRWAAWLEDSRMHLVYGHRVELESMLLDGTWYHSWYQRTPT